MSKRMRGRPAPPLTVSAPALLDPAGDDDGQFRELVHGLLAFAQRLEGVRSGFAAYLGLSGIQYTILISIAHLGQSELVEVNTVARHLHLSGAFVTIETGKLVQLGLIDKQPNPADRRRVLLSITARGEAELARLAPLQREVNDTLFACIAPGELAGHVAFVRELVTCSERAGSLLRHLLDEDRRRARA
jgi:MarR family transcriptional regulator, organic hydroperoxide resistance regulator